MAALAGYRMPLFGGFQTRSEGCTPAEHQLGQNQEKGNQGSVDLDPATCS